ncbi:MAG: glycosyltransferase [Verrucomicrobia bacterium]|nr:glycosyltransferase [Verrucomicrobiota bacterium]
MHRCRTGSPDTRLAVLNVAFPFAPAGPDAVGGAEQILSRLDHALVEAGHRSFVLAADGSRARGVLTELARPKGLIDDSVRVGHYRRYAGVLNALVRRHRPDVVHLHGVDFDRYLPDPGVPVLVTLHLPYTFYHVDFKAVTRPCTYLHCVSEPQRATFPALPNLLPTIENGVPLTVTTPCLHRDAYVVCLSRIAPEKNIHAALEAAKAAGVPLLLGGEVYPYREHQKYFEEKVAPRLDEHRRFLGPLDGATKFSLLRRARCLLQPSLAAETSSLVAMEALASGTPVVAYPSGALATLIEHGHTGFLVRNVEEMAEGIRRAGRIDPAACLAAAAARFDLTRMIRRYFETYTNLANGMETPHGPASDKDP